MGIFGQANLQSNEPLVKWAVPHTGGKMLVFNFFLTGDAYRDLQFAFSVPHNSISKFVPEVCEALYDCLKDDHLKVTSQSLVWFTVFTMRL